VAAVMPHRRHDGAPLRAPGPQLRPVAPPGTVACPACHRRVVSARWEETLHVCPACGHHARVPARHRAAQLADPGTLALLHTAVEDRDPLRFDDGAPYPVRIRAARAESGADEALVAGRAALGGVPVVLACMEFGFLGGSLGSATGELFARACELAVAERRALVTVCVSGGARMQEGVAALAQMARCTTGTVLVAAARLPFVALLADPCFGGVTASFATQADVIVAEPHARIGFAGGRVIEQAAHERLPEGFQTAEFLLAHGMVDAVVPRAELRDTLRRVLQALTSAP
jgi:acetyl-CoA carboxylase carboxyl transferase beta subunit